MSVVWKVKVKVVYFILFSICFLLVMCINDGCGECVSICVLILVVVMLWCVKWVLNSLSLMVFIFMYILFSILKIMWWILGC